MLHFIQAFPLITTRICLTYDFNIHVMSIEQEDSSLYIEDITRWREDMNFIFEWQNNILRTSAASELKYCFRAI